VSSAPAAGERSAGILSAAFCVLTAAVYSVLRKGYQFDGYYSDDAVQAPLILNRLQPELLANDPLIELIAGRYQSGLFDLVSWLHPIVSIQVAYFAGFCIARVLTFAAIHRLIVTLTGSALAAGLGVKYREGFIKNRYIARTFIMPGQQTRQKSVRQKLNAIDLEFQDRNVLLVDDSIVRGTTSSQIVQMAREAGARRVYFASAAPPVRHPNVYGIDMPAAEEFVAHGRDVEEICASIGADRLIFQELEDLEEAVRFGNKNIKRFDASCFSGTYITGDISVDYLTNLGRRRNDSAKTREESPEDDALDLSNAD